MINWENTEIMYKDSNMEEQTIREDVEIKWCKYNKLNKKEEIKSSSGIWGT